MMHRTQILLDPVQYDFLTREAQRCGSSMAAVIRRLVADHMGRERQPDDALESIIGIAGDGGKLAEADHDRLIYGLDRP